MTLAEQVADLQARVVAAQRERFRAEAARDQAKASAAEARAELERDFGISTVEQAGVQLYELKADLEDQIAQLTSALDRIGV